jgi:hypothetical protein
VDQAILTLCGQIGIGGILCWYLYYTTSVLMPRLYAAQQETVAQLVSQFREDLHTEQAIRTQLATDLSRLLMKLDERPCLLEEPASRAPHRHDGPLGLAIVGR